MKPKILVTALVLVLAASSSSSASVTSQWSMAEIDTAVTSINALNAAIANVEAGVYTSDSIIFVAKSTDNELRYDNLAAAYTQAKALTPGGNALSATNRATVIIPPGIYDAGTNTLILDANYVDIAAMFPEVSFDAHRDYTKTHVGIGYRGWTNGVPFKFPRTRIQGTLSNTNGHYAVIKQTVEDVRLEGFSVESYTDVDQSGKNKDNASYFIGLWVTAPEGGENSRYEKMTFWSEASRPGDGSIVSFPTLHQYHFDGEWIDSVGSDVSFRLYRDPGFAHTGTNQYFRPYMKNVHAGTFSFAGDSESGQIKGAYLETCTSPGAAFSGCSTYSMPIDSTTKFVDCHAVFGHSFGLMTTNASTMIRCTGGKACAGGSFLYASHKWGQFIGYAEDCDFGQGSLGGRAINASGDIPALHTNQYNSGTLVRCTIRDSVAPLQLKGATIRDSYFVQSSETYTNWTYAEIIGGVTNEIVPFDEYVEVDPPWYIIATNEAPAATDMFLVTDSSSIILDSVFEVNASSTGTVVTATNAQSVVFLNNTFNNSDEDPDGVGDLVTAWGGGSDWVDTAGADASINPMTETLNMGGYDITNLTANGASFTAGTGGALKLNKNLELLTGTIYTPAANISITDALNVSGLLTAEGGVALGSGDFFTLGAGGYMLDSSQTAAFTMDSGGIVLTSGTLDMNSSTIENIGALSGTDFIDATHIDWGYVGDQVDAANVPVNDSFGLYSGTDVEACLKEAKEVNYSYENTTKTLDSDQCYGGFVLSDTAITLTLPASVAGMSLEIYAIAGVALTVDVTGSDTIYLNGVAGGAGKYIQSSGSAGDCVKLVGIGNTWVAIEQEGTWSAEP